MPLPILVRRGHSQSIRAEGVPLGLLSQSDYQEVSLTLEKGDLLAIFSDGIVEANTREDEEFGTRRLENLLREHAQKPLAQIIEAIFTQLARFEQGRPRRDDQTLLLVRAK